MPRAYQKYEEDTTFGLIVSRGGIQYDSTGKFAFAAAIDNINVWNLHTGELEKSIKTELKHDNITIMLANDDASLLAVGTQKGLLHIYNIPSGEVAHVFAAHTAAVSAMTFSGTQLATGSIDRSIALWDLLEARAIRRLAGHASAVSGLCYSPLGLISAGKDRQILRWDLTTGECVQTAVGHSGEITALAAFTLDEGLVLVTGGAEPDLHIWRAEAQIEHIGTVRRAKVRDSVTSIHVDPIRPLLLVTGSKSIEALLIRDLKDARRRADRRRRRTEAHRQERKDIRRKKMEEAGLGTDMGTDQDDTGANDTDAGAAKPAIDGQDVLASIELVQIERRKVRAISLHQAGMAIAFSDNSISRLSRVDTSAKDEEPSAEEQETGGLKQEKNAWSKSQLFRLQSRIELPGHRSTVLDMNLNADDTLAASLSTNEVKIWTVRTNKCVRTVSIPRGARLVRILTGNRYIVVGDSDGCISLYDLASNALLERTQAHKHAVSALVLHRGLMISAGADGFVHNWTFELSAEGVLGMVLEKSFELDQPITDMTITPDGKLILAAVLDNTIRVHFADSFKFKLVLYGHSLTITKLTVSSDSQFVVTTARDKTIRIWGLVFGECKSIIKTTTIPLNVSFIRDTHFVFVPFENGVVRYYDTDRFKLIHELGSHSSAVHAIVVGHQGQFALTAGADLEIKSWLKGEGLVFPDSLSTQQASAGLDDELKERADGWEDLPVEMQTADTRAATERIADHLRVVSHCLETGQDDPALCGEEPLESALKMLRRMKPHVLHPAVMALPLESAESLLAVLEDGMEGEHMEFCVSLLLRVTSRYFRLGSVGGSVLASRLSSMKERVSGALTEVEGRYRRNLGCLLFLKQQVMLN
eukprot:gnl/Dysnectes_brevis/1562_a1772_1492.p1 GENE.gnl/Dysnectes_brevis/1562_a1772_1492~~gnl/Dysnectes_brevis/1562_a1772_1492.p1  ORF type:complete len:872 (+),score=260.42 gnl/Dysnectes_brevis/1562_a1772_1492:742-3357(+)